MKALEENPLRTKMLTAGTLAGLQEVIASWLAKDRNKHGHYFTSRVPKMAAYGALLSAPMGHVLIWLLQKTFRNRTSLKSKILQILVSNLIVRSIPPPPSPPRDTEIAAVGPPANLCVLLQFAPIQNSVYLVAMALIAGAKTFHQVKATVRVGFWKVMRISWITSPICLAFAQQFLSDNLWVPFFQLVAFVIGTYINTVTKKKRLAALRKKHFGSGSAQAGRSEDYNPQMSSNPNY